MPASSIVKHFTDGSVTLTDGAGHSLTVPLGNGDFKIDNLLEDQKEVKPYYARGVLVSLRKGQTSHPTIAFSQLLAAMTAAGASEALDFALRTGGYAANTSTTTALGDVYTIDVMLTIAGVSLGDASDHSGTFEDVAVIAGVAEGEPDTTSYSGTVYGDHTFV